MKSYGSTKETGKKSALPVIPREMEKVGINVAGKQLKSMGDAFCEARTYKYSQGRGEYKVSQKTVNNPV